MDVDNDLVDQTLLQQFSCLGTTDKEELINQLQQLAGDNITTATAAFFLDMNNWQVKYTFIAHYFMNLSL